MSVSRNSENVGTLSQRGTVRPPTNHVAIDKEAAPAPDHLFNLDQDLATVGEELHAFVAELFPIHRSITGNGVRETLRRVGQRIPLDIREVPSGTKVLDWAVPQEWNIEEAYVENKKGERIIDVQLSNLHVVNSSIPIDTNMSLEQLKPYLHTLPHRPDWIPYRYAHYSPNWGFCLTYRQLLELEEGQYHVCIRSSLSEGSLTYGECFLRGDQPDEILISCHVCHPSLANDNVSGIAVATFLAQALLGAHLRYSYRFIFVPSTIGAITWLAEHEEHLSRIRGGLVLSCVGDSGHPTYKKSRRGDSEFDRAVIHVLEQSGQSVHIQEFAPYGYDERQYNSPGFNLPVGLFTRTPHDCYPEYHTSADNLDFVHPESLSHSYYLCLSAFDLIENNCHYVNLQPKGEPQLGRRGLYRQLAGQADSRLDETPLLWVLNYSDGEHSLLDIAEKANISFRKLKGAADRLCQAGLLVETRRCS